MLWNLKPCLVNITVSISRCLVFVVRGVTIALRVVSAVAGRGRRVSVGRHAVGVGRRGRPAVAGRRSGGGRPPRPVRHRVRAPPLGEAVAERRRDDKAGAVSRHAADGDHRERRVRSATSVGRHVNRRAGGGDGHARWRREDAHSAGGHAHDFDSHAHSDGGHAHSFHGRACNGCGHARGRNGHADGCVGHAYDGDEQPEHSGCGAPSNSPVCGGATVCPGGHHTQTDEPSHAHGCNYSERRSHAHSCDGHAHLLGDDCGHAFTYISYRSHAH